ncbi:MAG: hypothetical protein M3256_21565, partial [Actinomycetota bacterium]|nr:hypothetical protein [Actinomycetota bacterium]
SWCSSQNIFIPKETSGHRTARRFGTHIRVRSRPDRRPETSNLSTASTAASVEANNIGELYWFAHSLPDPEHNRLQGLLRNYATIIAHQGWQLLGKGHTSPKASAATTCTGTL